MKSHEGQYLGKITSVSKAIKALEALENYKFIWDTTEMARVFPVPFPFGLFFRGHANSRWELEPSVFRKKDALDNDCHYEEANQYFHFQLRMPDYHTKYRTPFDWLCLMQHYQLPTRLLDWSESILVALYFAVREPEHDGKDGKLWVLHGGRLTALNDSVEPRTDPDHIHTPNSSEVFLRASMAVFRSKKGFIRNFNNLIDTHTGIGIPFSDEENRKKVIEIIEKGDEEQKRKICSPIAVFPNRLNGRMIAQSSLVTIHGGKKYHPDSTIKTEDKIPEPQGLVASHKEFYKNNSPKVLLAFYTIPLGDTKKKIRKELHQIGIHEGTLFPELDYQSKYVRDMWKSPLP